jgi:hypothetical protein
LTFLKNWIGLGLNPDGSNIFLRSDQILPPLNLLTKKERETFLFPILCPPRKSLLRFAIQRNSPFNPCGVVVFLSKYSVHLYKYLVHLSKYMRHIYKYPNYFYFLRLSFSHLLHVFPHTVHMIFVFFQSKYLIHLSKYLTHLSK